MHGDCVWALMGVLLCSDLAFRVAPCVAPAHPVGTKHAHVGRMQRQSGLEKAAMVDGRRIRGKSPCRGRLWKRDDAAKQAVVPPDPERVGFAAKTRDAAMKSRPGGDDARCDGERKRVRRSSIGVGDANPLPCAERRGLRCVQSFQRGSDPESASMMRCSLQLFPLSCSPSSTPGQSARPPVSCPLPWIS
jgi:hypothetical protein